MLAKLPRPEPILTVKVSGSDVRLRYRDIIYAEHFAHMINIRTTAGKTLATRQSFKAFTEPLKKDPRFFVCGRGAIVNLEHAADFQAAAFCMTDGSRVYVNQELLKPARQAFMEFLLQGGV
jgi:two-component system, LytTR family, response regulator LytT